MANSLTSNPIVLDTFSSAIDVGNSLYGDSNFAFPIEHIEWQIPTTAAHTATVTDGSSVDVFNEVCTVANQSIFKQFQGAKIKGLKIGANGVQSGKISILLGRK